MSFMFVFYKIGFHLSVYSEGKYQIWVLFYNLYIQYIYDVTTYTCYKVNSDNMCDVSYTLNVKIGLTKQQLVISIYFLRKSIILFKRLYALWLYVTYQNSTLFINDTIK